MNPSPTITLLLEPAGVSLMEALPPRSSPWASACGSPGPALSISQAPLQRARCPEVGVRQRLKGMQSGPRSPLRPQPLRSPSSPGAQSRPLPTPGAGGGLGARVLAEGDPRPRAGPGALRLPGSEPFRKARPYSVPPAWRRHQDGS